MSKRSFARDVEFAVALLVGVGVPTHVSLKQPSLCEVARSTSRVCVRHASHYFPLRTPNLNFRHTITP
eukprot:scaffold102_cov133-Isochrysis_galbana.AAC.7